MNDQMKRALSGAGKALVLAVTVSLGAGCIGIYNNSETFRTQPYQGMEEMAMLRTYGTPDWQGFVEDKKVYTYEVRDNKYILIIGVYEGYDLIVTVENGEVREATRVERPRAFTLLSPLPWAESD